MGFESALICALVCIYWHALDLHWTNFTHHKRREWAHCKTYVPQAQDTNTGIQEVLGLYNLSVVDCISMCEST